MNRPKWAQRNPKSDPIGPGSPAWETFDIAVEHAKDRNTKLFNAARARMHRHLKAAGYAPTHYDADLERAINENEDI